MEDNSFFVFILERVIPDIYAQCHPDRQQVKCESLQQAINILKLNFSKEKTLYCINAIIQSLEAEKKMIQTVYTLIETKSQQ